MATFDWVVLGAVVAAVSAVISKFPPNSLFATDKYPNWNPGVLPSLAYFLCFAMAATLIWFAIVISQIHTAEFQTEQARVQKEVDSKIADANASAQREKDAAAAALEAKREAKVAELELEMSEVKRFMLPSQWNATQGTKAIPRRKISEQRTQVIIDDSKGEDALLIVFHYFPDAAYWRYNEFALFEDKDAQPLDFLSELHATDFREDVADYDYLIGVGLDSKSAEFDVRMAPLRANFLCASLAGAAKKGKPVVRGLSIGSYDSDRIDTKERRQPYQRPVLILGVKKLKPAVHIEQMVESVMDNVRVKGVDLSRYSALAGKEQLRWFEVPECDTGKL